MSTYVLEMREYEALSLKQSNGYQRERNDPVRTLWYKHSADVGIFMFF